MQLWIVADMPAKTETLRWVGDHRGHLVLIDQTRLPVELIERDCPSVVAVWEAIKQLRVRGAPAIGIAAANAPARNTGARKDSISGRRPGAECCVLRAACLCRVPGAG